MRIKDWLQPLYTWGTRANGNVDLNYGSDEGEDILTDITPEQAKKIKAVVNNLVGAVWFLYDRSSKETQDKFRDEVCEESPLKPR